MEIIVTIVLLFSCFVSGLWYIRKRAENWKL